MKEVEIYKNAQFGQVRTSMTEQGEPLFCLADVCKALALTNPSDVKRRLQQRGVCTIDTPTTNQYGAIVMQQMNFITEPNLYKCIFQSRKKEAEAFQDWVCSEVLPSIRKTGQYQSVHSTSVSDQLSANLAFADWNIRQFNLNEASKFLSVKIQEKFAWVCRTLYLCSVQIFSGMIAASSSEGALLCHTCTYDIK